MQSLFLVLEEADAHRRNGKLNMALKKYMTVKSVSSSLPSKRINDMMSQVFDEFEHDQFDFHGYNLRKFTINVYLQCA